MARVLNLQQGIIYGPVSSRRLGRSLGLNLQPTKYKVCPFNCVYCHYGWTAKHTKDLTPLEEDLPTPHRIKEALESYLEKDKDIDYITFSGNGEPTSHPKFDEIVELVREVRNRLVPHRRIAVLSNSTMLDDPKVVSALQKLDVRIMKLDCGTEEIFQRFNRPVAEITLDKIRSGLKELDDFVIQTLLAGGENGNLVPESISRWQELIRALKPEYVQLYSLENPPADSSLEEIPKEKLREIAAETESKTGIRVEVY
jgi:wyosine [tRNA(Phe)-imidazoG37] synthetase (radical SAM superfamily)